MTEPYDVVLRNGMLVDPANGRQGVHDVAMRDGKIVGRRGRLITTPMGTAAVRAAGLEAIVVEPGTMLRSPQ